MLLELPSNRTEAWRWSDLSALPALAEATPSGAVPADLPWIECEIAGPRLLFVDGVFVAEKSDPREVKVAAARYKPGTQPLADFAGTQAKAGYVISLGADGATSGLVQIVHVSTGGAAHLSNRIALEANAQASVVETHVGSGWSNTTSVFELGEGARLMRVVRVLKDGGVHTDFAMTSVGEAASYDSIALVTGADSARIENDIVIAGEGAYAEAGGALLARGSQKLEGVTVLRHGVPLGTSRQVWRSVADDRATCSVAARVEVARDAQKTDGEQSLKGLLLDRAGTINAKPELEIFADDVKCAHGATVGELDRNALFYLESRGVTPDEAKALLTRAFVADALDRIGEEAVRTVCYADAEAWFGGAQ
ncbi:SufD family Fe-S cluster assembly protein [Sphingosinicella sp. LHD-64]|uniref:SufB/SufD family protein n=1 Tax=Sphingosinicella sp. LHD-64 TaxID=3072139 RepID=UPI00280C4636|nr:SufD family Fe-S cluster assembly protein [Sphingosinicella sp. LHD-64]MDQ8757002.1 SufD family Fe-S cluster assembly protein [Sphingosinicella sp. LHD-64]